MVEFIEFVRLWEITLPGSVPFAVTHSLTFSLALQSSQNIFSGKVRLKKAITADELHKGRCAYSNRVSFKHYKGRCAYSDRVSDKHYKGRCAYSIRASDKHYIFDRVSNQH